MGQLRLTRDGPSTSSESDNRIMAKVRTEKEIRKAIKYLTT